MSDGYSDEGVLFLFDEKCKSELFAIVNSFDLLFFLIRIFAAVVGVILFPAPDGRVVDRVAVVVRFRHAGHDEGSAQIIVSGFGIVGGHQGEAVVRIIA